MLKRVMSRFSVEIVLSHGIEKLCRGTFCVSQNFRCRKILFLRGLCHDFLSNFFCLAVPKNFVWEPSCVSQNFWYRKILWMRARGGGMEGVSGFSLKKFCLTVPRNFVEELFLCFRKFLVSKNVRDKRGGITIFRQKRFVSQYQNNS